MICHTFLVVRVTRVGFLYGVIFFIYFNLFVMLNIVVNMFACLHIVRMFIFS